MLNGQEESAPSNLIKVSAKPEKSSLLV